MDPVPAKRAYITVNGQDWELIPTGKLTWAEARLAKEVSGGLALVDIDKGIASGDPDAWFAWIYVSIRRAWPHVTPDELEQTIGDTPLIAVIDTVRQEAPEVANPDPPAQPFGSASGGPPNGHDSGETIPQPSTLETAGQQT